MKTQFKLTPENAARIVEYSQIIGWTETELVNHLLAESLGWWDDTGSGSLEGFLGGIFYRDRTGAERALERVIQMAQKQFDGQLPASFKSAIRELPDSRFDFVAEYIDCHGDLQSVC